MPFFIRHVRVEALGDDVLFLPSTSALRDANFLTAVRFVMPIIWTSRVLELVIGSVRSAMQNKMSRPVPH